jgi:branched-chain amino acid transport system ATP-binding protein
VSGSGIPAPLPPNPLPSGEREYEAPLRAAEGGDQALLEVEHASRLFGGLAALDDVSFAVPPGTICGLIGPNGAGKTTLINAVSGLTPLTSGVVRVGGVSLDRRPPHRIAALGVSRTFQNVHLFGDLSVVENVMVGHHLRQRSGLLQTVLRLPRARAEEWSSRERALSILARLGMDRLATVPAGDLSYGDQRRVEVARALALDPRLLLLDEPAAGMNAPETEALGDLLLELRASGLTMLIVSGLTMLIVEHDMGLIMRVSDQVVVLSFGRKIAEGAPSEVRKNPQVIQAYLGEEVA